MYVHRRIRIDEMTDHDACNAHARVGEIGTRNVIAFCCRERYFGLDRRLKSPQRCRYRLIASHVSAVGTIRICMSEWITGASCSTNDTQHLSIENRRNSWNQYTHTSSPPRWSSFHTFFFLGPSVFEARKRRQGGRKRATAKTSTTFLSGSTGEIRRAVKKRIQTLSSKVLDRMLDRRGVWTRILSLLGTRWFCFVTANKVKKWRISGTRAYAILLAR